MHEFFKGWRRKVGCVSLALTCVVVIGYTRSIALWDILVIADGFPSVSFHSCDGTIVLSVSEESLDSDQPTRLIIPNWNAFPLKYLREFETRNDDLVGYWRETKKIHVDLYGFRVTTNKGGSRHQSFKTKRWTVHYGHLVLPLMTVSAWLLLLKPRSRVSLSNSQQSTA